MRSIIPIKQLIKISTLSFRPNISDMSKIIYNKKSELLEDLGKDKKDTRYLDRAMERREIVMIDGYYIPKDALVSTVIGLLIWENKELKEKVESFSEISERMEEMEANIKYYEMENEELRNDNKDKENKLNDIMEKFGLWYAS